jgi:adenine C2-methylase RlmN of 23S rRNA A2503 and tRNA A37
MGCKFCWLTVTKQTKFQHTTIDEYGSQLDIVLNHAKQIDKDNSKNVRVNINLMSRGEALANKNIINNYPSFYNEMNTVAKKYDYAKTKINISTIMPSVVADRKLFDIFHHNPINLYYSLYSINDNFRKKWLPNAMPWRSALDKLWEFHDATNNTITFHFAIIENENDDIGEIKKMSEIIKNMNFKSTKFNLVRYNPHPSQQYKEPPIEKLNEIYDIFKSACNDNDIKTNKSRIVPRIGYDVFASCGMFYDNNL